MAKLFDLSDRRYWVYQPTIVRWRHRFKGVRESLKINQEIGQYHYDINYVRAKLNAVKAQLIDDSSIVVNGGYIEGCWFQWDGDSTPSLAPMYIEGFDALAGRVERLRNRVRTLEGN